MWKRSGSDSPAGDEQTEHSIAGKVQTRPGCRSQIREGCQSPFLKLLCGRSWLPLSSPIAPSQCLTVVQGRECCQGHAPCTAVAPGLPSLEKGSAPSHAFRLPEAKSPLTFLASMPSVSPLRQALCTWPLTSPLPQHPRPSPGCLSSGLGHGLPGWSLCFLFSPPVYGGVIYVQKIQSS